jgi:CRP-like cAMP-binding protein
MDRTEVFHLLRDSEFFKGLQEDRIEQILDLCSVEAYAAGDHIFRQGDWGDLLYIVAEGHVILERSLDLGLRKGKVAIGMLNKGRVFGCWSTLLDEQHTLMSSAVCRKPTRIVVIKGADLRQMMLDNNALGFNVLQRLCFLLRDRLMGAYEAMEDL